MFLHSETISVFITRVRILAREIVNAEMGLKMERSRIFYKGILYPLNIVVFEDNSRLGYFDSRSYELGLSKKLMYLAKTEVLKNVIRHELAHFVCYLLYGPQVLHGEEFHKACISFGWGPEVYGAYANIDLENDRVEIENEKTERLLSRIKKLLALASSDNTHERELATLKANQLLLEHNLDLSKSAQSTEEIVYVKRVLEASRKSAKHVAIYEILKTFFVSPVFNHGRGIFYLEVIGDRTSVELADYVANFLDHELEVIWKQTQKENPKLKGTSSKNSFFNGVAKGYVEKIQKQKSTIASGSELVAIEKNIQKNLRIVYPRIGHSSLSAGMHNADAHNAGKVKGSSLSIKPALNSGSSSKQFLLNSFFFLFILTSLSAHGSACRNNNPSWLDCSKDEDCKIVPNPCGHPLEAAHIKFFDVASKCYRIEGAAISCATWDEMSQGKTLAKCVNHECIAAKK